MRLALITFSIFLMAFSCASKKNAKQTAQAENIEVSTKNHFHLDDTSIIAEFATSYCFGKCPVYNLIIKADGEAIYKPEAHTVLEKGTYSAQVDSSTIREVFTIANDINFFDFDSVYTDPYIQDLPSTFITLFNKESNALKSVEFVIKQPEGYKALNQALRKVVDSTNWEKVNNSRD